MVEILGAVRSRSALGSIPPPSCRSRQLRAPPPGVALECLHVHARLEQSCLPARDFHLGAVFQLHVQASADAELHALDEIQVDELTTVGPEESPRIDALLEARERTAE